MTADRINEITTRLAEIEDACESCATDDPPWGMIQDAFDLLDEALTELRNENE